MPLVLHDGCVWGDSWFELHTDMDSVETCVQNQEGEHSTALTGVGFHMSHVGTVTAAHVGCLQPSVTGSYLSDQCPLVLHVHSMSHHRNV